MADSDIQGTITDASGNVVANAVVALWLQDSPNEVATTQTDSSGNYIFEKHPDSDGTFQNWHLAVRDPNDSSRQFASHYSVSAKLGETLINSVVDNFEELVYEDQGNTLSNYYNGDLSAFQRAQNAVNEGSYSLESSGGDSSDLLISLNGLPNYPQPGDTFQWSYRDTNFPQAQSFTAFARTSSSNREGYYIGKNQNDDLRISRYDNGSRSILAQTNWAASSNTWYTFEVTWGTNGDISLDVYNPNNSVVAELSANDSTYTGKGIEFNRNYYTGNTGTVYWDNFKL